MPARQIPIRLLEPVGDALRARRPVVALESSVLAQGLPIPANREAATRMRRAIESRGAVPAIAAVVRGVAALGLEDEADLRGLEAAALSRLVLR